MEKQSKEVLFALGCCLTLIFCLVIISKIESPTQELDCSSPPNVFYLTPSEKGNIQIILEDPNAVVVIPEENYFLANTELLECEGIDLTKYLDGLEVIRK